MSSRLLVAGGTGFIGSEICKQGVLRSFEMVSLSRSNVIPRRGRQWVGRVDWQRGDIMDPGQWRHLLTGCTAIIHAIGITSEDPDAGVTFERYYRDSVAVAAREAMKAGVRRFVYLSSDASPPFRSPRYLTAKRGGEEVLEDVDLETASLRPAYVYGPDFSKSMIMATLLKTAEKLPGIRIPLHSIRPLRVEQVAVAALRAATEPGIHGILDITAIERLGGKVRRRRASATATP